MSDQENNSANATAPSGGRGAVAFSRGECLEHYTWGDGCYGWTFIDTPELSVKQELMPPETREKRHYHERARQVFFILKGRATFNIDGVTTILKPEQGIEIEPGQKHYITNDGSVDLEFVLYSSPNTKGDRVEG